MTRLLLFGEFIDSNLFFILFLQKLNILNPQIGLGTYLQGIAAQNTVDFIWGTASGARSFLVALFFTIAKFIFFENWYIFYAAICIFLPFILFILAFRLIKKVDTYTVIAALFYSLNYWIILRLLSGFWQLNIVYSLLPFIVTVPLVYLKKEKNFRTLLFYGSFYAILSSLIIIAQPHFLIMISFYLLLHMASIFFNDKKKLFFLIKFYLLSTLLFVFLNLYIWIPAIFYPEPFFTAPNQYFSIGSVIFNGTGCQIENILRLAPITFPFKPISWNFVNYLQFFPIIFTIFIFLKNKKRNYLFLFSLFIFTFLSKGLNLPFASLSEWLYRYIPPLHFFRDPSRFLGGVALFSSLIIASYEDTKKNYKLKRSLLVFVLVVLLLSIKNLILIDFKKTIKSTLIPDEYIKIQKIVNGLKNSDQRILTIPNEHIFSGYPFYENKNTPPSNSLFDMAIPFSKPLANSTNFPDNYSNQISYFEYKKFTENYDLTSLSPLGIKYILLDSSILFPLEEKKVATLSAKILKSNDSLKLISETKNLHFFEIKHSNKLITNKKPLFVIGNFESINKVKKIDSDRPVILLNQKINSDLLIPSVLKNEELLIDDEQALKTLVAESLANDYSVDILTPVWDWDKNFTNCEPYKMKYINKIGNIFTSGRCISSDSLTGQIDIPVKIGKGEYRILIKVLTTAPSTNLKIKIANKNFNNEFNTGNKLIWMDLGKIEVESLVEKIYMVDDETKKIIIDYLVIVPESEYQDRICEVEKIFNSMKIVNLSNIKKNDILDFVAIKKIDRITLKESQKYLTYRFTWGKNWRSKQESVVYISDGYGMTFIAKDQNISKICYPANQAYHLALVVSAITFLILSIYILKYQALVKKKLF